MPPAAIGAAVPIAMGVGGAVATQALSGKGNTYQGTAFSQTPDYDANRFEYGGRPGGAAAAVGRAQGFGDGARGTSGAYQNSSFDLQGHGQRWMDQSFQARQQQQEIAAAQRARALGLVPSISEMQAQRDMQRVAAEQASAAASSRGAGAIALGQLNAAGNVASAQGHISGQAQINAAQERLAAENAAAQSFANIRAGDYTGAGTSFGAASQMGQLGLGYGNLGLGYENLGHNINQAQLNAGVQNQQLLNQSRTATDELNAGLRQAQVNRTDRLFDKTMDYLGKGFQAGGLGGPQGGGGGGGVPQMGGGASGGGGGGGGGSSGLGGTGHVPNGGNF